MPNLSLPAVRALSIALAVALFFSPQPVRAQPDAQAMSAHDLLGFCQSRYDTDYGFCAGYLTALTEQLSQAAGIDGQGGCVFGQARSQQFVDLFRAYAEKSPDALHAPARTIAAAALTRAFPCSSH